MTMRSHMARTISAGATYFAVVFGFAFVFGTVRTVWVSPYIGPTGGVLLEVPLLLIVSWLACGRCVRHFDVPEIVGHRLIMGGVAFACLVAAEVGFSALLFGQSIAEFLAAYSTPAGGIGLAAQIAFGLIPSIGLLWPFQPRPLEN